MRTEPLLAAVGVAGGATVALLLDPRSGRRRRALVRDKLQHYAKRAPKIARRRAKWLTGLMRSAPFRVVGLAPRRGMPDLDATELTHRVETELGRDSSLPLSVLNFDAVDSVIRIRGRVSDAHISRRVVERTAAVAGVRAAISLMRTADGERTGGVAGDLSAFDAWRRAELQSERLRADLCGRWPALSDADILASDGQPGRLCARIMELTGEPEQTIRPELDAILLSEL